MAFDIPLNEYITIDNVCFVYLEPEAVADHHYSLDFHFEEFLVVEEADRPKHLPDVGVALVVILVQEEWRMMDHKLQVSDEMKQKSFNVYLNPLKGN